MGKQYLLFDPHSRDANGLISTDGTSALLKFKSLLEVEKYIQEVYVSLTWDRMYQSLISARVPIYLSIYGKLRLVKFVYFTEHVSTIKNGDNLLSESFLYTCLRWRRSSAR